MTELNERSWAEAMEMYERRVTIAKVTSREHADFEERREALEADAGVILSRFPEGSHFYANTGRSSATCDYYQRVSEWQPFSTRTFDFGLVLVSETEVGMVWSFR